MKLPINCRLISVFLLATCWSGFILSSGSAQQIGENCSSDDDCGRNQECVAAGKPCANPERKTCQCKQCFGPNADKDACQRVVLKAPCSPDDDDCDPSCSTSNGFEVYPPNAECNTGDTGSTDGFVQCQPSSCYQAVNGKCVATGANKKAYRASCSADCECQSNLGCVASCACPPGTRWDATAATCSTRKANFGETCSSNAECNTNGAADLGNGFTSSGGVCSSGKCACADGYQQTVTGFYVDGAFTTKIICVIAGTKVDTAKGERCNINPIYSSDEPSSAVCNRNTACYACEGERQANLFGKCREFSVRLETCDNPSSGSDSTNNNDRVRRVNTSCTASDQCGFKEVCQRPPVDPPCLTGKCACRACHGLGPNGLCSPKRRLKLRDRCEHSGDEIYPPMMTCSANDNVDCLNDRYKVAANESQCVLQDYSYVSFGVVCNDGYSNCFPGLQCLPTSKKCLCKHSNEFYDAASGRCVQRQLGAECRYNHDCDDNSKTQTRSSGRVCNDGRCQCDANFKPATNPVNNALEIVPPKCGQDGASAQSRVCKYCPEDQLNQKCAFFNVSLVTGIATTDRNKPEVCFPNQFSAPAPTSAPPAAPPAPFVLGSMRAPDSDAPAPAPVAPASQSGHKVGRDCNSNNDCGENEMCFSPYDPICSGTCICKPGHDMNEVKACVPTPAKRLGEPCTGYTRPDLFQYQYKTKMYCDEGEVYCGECPALTCSTTAHAVQENEACSDPCDCDGDMICNMRQGTCMCSSPLQRFDTNLKLCVSKRDTERRRNGIGCRVSSGCSRDDMTCDPTLLECTCSGPGYRYNYKDGLCYPRNFGDSCSEDSQCKGKGILEGNYGYSTKAGATCVNGKCGCASGYASVTVAFDTVKSLWQQSPVNRTLCLPQEIATGDFVPKGGPCSLNPLSSDASICEPGLYCVQCPQEPTGKCRQVRDIIRT